MQLEETAEVKISNFIKVNIGQSIPDLSLGLTALQTAPPIVQLYIQFGCDSQGSCYFLRDDKQ